jgi:oligopeptide transport system permease protein
VIRFAIRRLVSIVPTLFFVASLSFVLIRVVPGGPFDGERAVSAEAMKALSAKYHLDDPLWKQYKDWLSDLVLRGDLGPTFKYASRSVNEIIALSLPVSLELGALALIFALALGIPLGVVGAARRNTAADAASMAAALVGISVPRFVLAPLLVYVFALQLHVLPVARWDGPRHMVLPVICAGLPLAAYIARLTRAGMLEILSSDFVRTARAKGLSETRVILKHALRGGLLPVVSYLGPGTSSLLVGSLVVEKIFNIPGMGRYFVEAATNRDYNLVVGLSLVYGVVLMVMNVIVDVAYALVDPRVELR